MVLRHDPLYFGESFEEAGTNGIWVPFWNKEGRRITNGYIDGNCRCEGCEQYVMESAIEFDSIDYTIENGCYESSLKLNLDSTEDCKKLLEVNQETFLNRMPIDGRLGGNVEGRNIAVFAYNSNMARRYGFALEAWIQDIISKKGYDFLEPEVTVRPRCRIRENGDNEFINNLKEKHDGIGYETIMNLSKMYKSLRKDGTGMEKAKDIIRDDIELAGEPAE